MYSKFKITDNGSAPVDSSVRNVINDINACLNRHIFIYPHCVFKS